MSAPLRAVLFDLDGTITDTEPIWAEVLDEVAAELGGSLTADLHATMVGMPMRPSVELVHAAVGVERDWEITRDELLARLAGRYRNALPCRPGARELLAEVRAAGLLTALVTATERPLVELVLAHTLSAGSFDVVITGSDVQRAKPDPEPYLAALAGLAVTAEEAVAIEDSAHGVASATAAGVLTLVVPSDAEVPAGELRVRVPSLLDITAEGLQLGVV